MRTPRSRRPPDSRRERCRDGAARSRSRRRRSPLANRREMAPARASRALKARACRAAGRGAAVWRRRLERCPAAAAAAAAAICKRPPAQRQR
eukprot:4560266-Prymnesium_polylepis.1